MPQPYDFKILVVEDNDDARELLCEMIAGYGFIIREAADGQTGLNKIIKEEPDLIFLDIMMPRKDGIQVMQKMIDDEIKIPVVLTTAINDYDTVKKAMAMGAAEYLVKPYDLNRIIETIEKILNIPLTTEGATIEDFSYKLEKEGDLLYIHLEGELAVSRLLGVKENVVRSLDQLQFKDGPKILVDVRDVYASSIQQKEVRTLVDILMLLGDESIMEKSRVVVSDTEAIEAIKKVELGKFLKLTATKLDAKKQLRK